MKSLRSQPGRLVEVEWAPTGRSMFLVAVLRWRGSTGPDC